MDPNNIAAQANDEEDQLSAAIDELRDVLHDGTEPEPGFGLSDPGMGLGGPELDLTNPGLGMPEGLGMSEPSMNMPDSLDGMQDQGFGTAQSGFGSSEAAPSVGAATAAGQQNHGVIMDIPVDVQIVLGSTEMPVSELMALHKGSTVALDRKIGEPVDVIVNGRKIAAGEVTVLESDPSRFGIKLTHIVDASRKG